MLPLSWWNKVIYILGRTAADLNRTLADRCTRKCKMRRQERANERAETVDPRIALSVIFVRPSIDFSTSSAHPRVISAVTWSHVSPVIRPSIATLIRANGTQNKSQTITALEHTPLPTPADHCPNQTCDIYGDICRNTHTFRTPRAFNAPVEILQCRLDSNI